MINHNSKSELSSVSDLNGYGVLDVSYEDVEDGYYQLIDRNLDGKKDESNFYNLSDKLLSAKYDVNYDGILETRAIFSESGLYEKMYVDTDNNGIDDIIFIYKDGVLESSRRYYKNTPNKEQNSIGEIKYMFNYPSLNEKYLTTNLSEEDFLTD